MPVDVIENQAFVTLATNDTYSLGALVLGHSLRQVDTNRKLVVMVTPGVTLPMRDALQHTFDIVHEVDVLDSRDAANLALLTRPDLGVTFTKLHCWRLTQFNKCVFLDADTLVLQNIDDLFQRDELSAAPDPGWPDCFNSGVFVFCPSDATYNALLQLALTQGSFDGGDQGLLNLFFHDWSTKDIARHLPFTYNVVSQTFYSYLPAFKQFGKDTKVVHFIGSQKPWHMTYNVSSGQVTGQSQQTSHGQEMLQSWWTLFFNKVQPSLQPGMAYYIHIEYPPALVDQCEPVWPSYSPPQVPVYEMTSPFIPPIIQTFYEPLLLHSVHVAPVLEETIIENKREKPYEFFECFYCEPPMASRDQYHTPLQEAYEAKDFDQICQKMTKVESVNEESKHSSNIDNTVSNNIISTKDWLVDEKNIIHPTPEKENIYDAGIPINETKDALTPLQENIYDIVRLVLYEVLASLLDFDELPSVSKILSDGDLEVKKDGKLVDLEGDIARLSIDTAATIAHPELNDRLRQAAWERGQIDYKGADSFDNIQKVLDEQLNTKASEPFSFTGKPSA